MVSWHLYWSRQAKKDAKRVLHAGLRGHADYLLDIFERNPFQNPPAYEKLSGDLEGLYSRRINIHHRLVYQVIKHQRAVKIIRLWTHYE